MSHCKDCNDTNNCRELRSIPGCGGNEDDGSQKAPIPLQKTKFDSCLFDVLVYQAEDDNYLPTVRVRIANSCGRVLYETTGENLYTKPAGGQMGFYLLLDVTNILPGDGHYNVYVDADNVAQPPFKILRECDACCRRICAGC